MNNWNKNQSCLHEIRVDAWVTHHHSHQAHIFRVPFFPFEGRSLVCGKVKYKEKEEEEWNVFVPCRVWEYSLKLVSIVVVIKAGTLFIYEVYFFEGSKLQQQTSWYGVCYFLPLCSVRLWTEIRVEEGSWVERNVTHEMWIKTLPS